MYFGILYDRICLYGIIVFSSIVQVSSSMKDQTLADIDEKLVGAGRFLSEFAGRKLECITKFSECQDIVQWIRNTTKGE